jgi:acetoin utilization deacetylase AcuC-like enzyme
MYCSTHQMPLYPGTGARSERGDHDTIVNAPLSPGAGGDTFREAFEVALLPRLDAFRPDLVVISAGFDAHWRDPLANLQLKEADFSWATLKLMDLAERHAGRPRGLAARGRLRPRRPVAIRRRACHGADGPVIVVTHLLGPARRANVAAP